jgi:L-lactate dehydrogenase complex protein LldE
MPDTRPDAVYFYATCLVDMFYPKVGLASIELIQREGVKVIFPPDQSCCGQPAWNSGYREQAAEVIASQLKLFPRDLPIVVPSASCAGMIKNHWPQAFKPGPQQQLAMSIAERVLELTDFLLNRLGYRPAMLKNPMKVAVHNSCSSIRHYPVAGNIEALLESMGAELREQANKAECCGFGGTFCVKQADISGNMVQDKCTALLDCGAEVILSQDCGCLMNIGGAFDKAGRSLKIQHVAEFLREQPAPAGSNQ